MSCGLSSLSSCTRRADAHQQHQRHARRPCRPRWRRHSRRASKTIRARCTLCLALRKERHLRIISDLRGDRTSHQVKHDICHSHVQEWIEVEEEVPKRKKKKKSKKKKKAAEAADATSADEPPADIDGSATPAEPVAAGA